ncbi:MAG: hypothetical protein LLG00_08095, partial [Planctomycetaceae bacterium]|nr:hypothetical protein [Planctomycetaceae bacterium]
MKHWRWVLLGGVLAMTGCTMVPVTEWNATQAQNRALAEQNKAQLVQIDNLQEHCRVVENRMLSDERQLAGLRERAAADRRELETCRRE